MFKNNSITNLVLILSLYTLVSCVHLPKTIAQDLELSYTEIDGYKFHTQTYGSPEAPKVIVVHGGPGGDFEYLKSLKALATNHQVIFYDQRGSGLSPRVESETLTLEQNIKDLHSTVKHFGKGKKVKLIGHSWGGMLVVGYLSKYPEQVSQSVIIEPGMLNQKASVEFVSRIKSYQSFTDVLGLVGHISVYPFVNKQDGHEGFDYVMTKMLNNNKPGKPYQCDEASMPKDVFKRGGYEAFNTMLKPVMDEPKSFTYELAKGIQSYRGGLLMISSECSVFGYDFQKEYHLGLLPKQTIHIQAKGMGHNMITINPEWSLEQISGFLKHFYPKK